MLTLKRRFRRILGSSVEFDLEPYTTRLERIDGWAAEVAASDDAGLTRWAGRLRADVGDGVGLDQVLDELFALAREASQRVLGTRPFDEQIVGGLAMHHGKIAEFADRRGQDAGRGRAGGPQRADRPRCARADIQRLSRSPGRRLDGSGLPAPRRERGSRPGGDAPSRAQGRLQLRRHLRDGQRGRLRCAARWPLPARCGSGAPPLSVRAGRRGRLDPDRRGADSSGHRGARRRGERGSGAGGVGRQPADPRHRFHQRRASSQCLSDRAGQRPGRGAVRPRQPLRPREPASADRAPERLACRVPARTRRRLHRPRWQGGAGRRLHGASRRQAAVAGRAASRHRVQGAARGPARRKDPRLDHRAAFSGHLSTTVRDDRHGTAVGGGAQGILRSRHRGSPAPQAVPAPRPRGRHLHQPSGQVAGPRDRDRPGASHRSADPGRHGECRRIRAAGRRAHPGGGGVPHPQRQARRGRGRGCGCGGVARRGHDFHQHGRPGHRHQAGRPSRQGPRGGGGARWPLRHRRQSPREPAGRSAAARP